jgi:outer membrane protein TolC
MLRTVTKLECAATRRNKRFLAIAALLALPAAAHAQTPGAMGRLVDEALRNNLGLAQARASEDRAAAEVKQARGLMLPSLSLESRYSEQNGTLNLGDVVNPAFATLNQLTGDNRFPTDLDLALPRQHDSRVRVTQPVFNETIRNNYALARHRGEAERWQRRSVARKLAADVQSALLNASAARAAVGILESSMALVAENERVAQRLVSANQSTAEVVFRARAERSDVEQHLAEARERADAARRSLNRLVGRDLDAPLDALPADSLLCLEIGVSAEEAEASALARREELLAAGEGVEAAAAARRIANAGLLPSVSVAVDYGFTGNDVAFTGSDDYVVASVVLSWTPFDGGRTLAGKEAARADVARVRASREETRDLVRLDVRQSYDAALVARSAIDVAEDRLAAARRTFELVRRKYDEGIASQIEFIDARTALTNAELNRAVTIHRWGVRWVELERAAALKEIGP